MRGPYYVNSPARRLEAWGRPCQVKATAGIVTIDGRLFRCHRDSVKTFEAWERIRARHGYRLTGDDTGFYNCRRMRHNPSLPWSDHAWGKALDVNWLENPAGSKLVTDIPPAMIRDLLAVKTVSGAFLFKWLGDPDRNTSTQHSYYDAMHFAEYAHPLDIATGIVIPGEHEVIGMQKVIRHGDRGAAVTRIQEALNAWNPNLALVEDGVFGDQTTAAVRFYQAVAGFVENGECDAMLCAWILSNGTRNPETLDRLHAKHRERLMT